MRDRRAERREATKTEIIEAAWDLCRAQGVAALSLRDLAGQVGMQAPSLYSYFRSKDAIYDAMFATGYREFVAAQKRVELSGDTRLDLKRLLGEFVTFCTSDVVRYQLLFQRTIPGFTPSEESFAISAEHFQTMADWFEDVGLGGQQTLDLFSALGTGLASQQISNDPGGDRWLRLIDDAVDTFFSHVQAGSAAKPRTRTSIRTS